MSARCFRSHAIGVWEWHQSDEFGGPDRGPQQIRLLPTGEQQSPFARNRKPLTRPGQQRRFAVSQDTPSWYDPLKRTCPEEL